MIVNLGKGIARLGERNSEHKFAFEFAQTYNIYLCKMRLSFCNLCTRIRGVEGGWMTICKCTITAKSPLRPTIPCVCKTEVRTINGFMLITIWNVNAWGNAMQIIFDYHKLRNTFNLSFRCDFMRLFILKVLVQV
jgi:hypothetical protein